MDGVERRRFGRPQPRLRTRGRARRLTPGEADDEHGEVARQVGDLGGAVEWGEVQVQGRILNMRTSPLGPAR